MAAMDEIHNFLRVQKFDKISHILQSHYPPSGNVQVIYWNLK